MSGIVGVAGLLAAVEGRPVVRRQRISVTQAARQVWVGDKNASERNGVSVASGNRRFRCLAGKTAGRDQDTAPDRPEQHHRRRHVLVIDLGAASAARTRLDEMQIGKAKRVSDLMAWV